MFKIAKRFFYEYYTNERNLVLVEHTEKQIVKIY